MRRPTTLRMGQGMLGSVVVGKTIAVAMSAEVVRTRRVNWGGGVRMLPSV